MFVLKPVTIFGALFGISWYLGIDEVHAAPQMLYGGYPPSQGPYGVPYMQQGPYGNQYMAQQGPYMQPPLNMNYMQPSHGGYPYSAYSRGPEEQPDNKEAKPAEQQGGYHAKHTLSAFNGQFLNDINLKLGKR